MLEPNFEEADGLGISEIFSKTWCLQTYVSFQAKNRVFYKTKIIEDQKLHIFGPIAAQLHIFKQLHA